LKYIMHELQQEMELPLRIRVRRFVIVHHFISLDTQLWRRERATYGHPGVRVDLWAEIQLNVFTSAREGEYIESTALVFSATPSSLFWSLRMLKA
jgi:hypothetical protein